MNAHECENDSDHSDFWLNIYDIQQERDMFASALHYLIPSLFSENNVTKWDVNVKYVPAADGNHKISFGLDVFEPIDAYFYRAPVHLDPGKTRELMISMKPTPAAFEQRYNSLGYDLLAQKDTTVNVPINGPKGKVSTMILGYDGK